MLKAVVYPSGIPLSTLSDSIRRGKDKSYCFQILFTNCFFAKISIPDKNQRENGNLEPRHITSHHIMLLLHWETPVPDSGFLSASHSVTGLWSALKSEKAEQAAERLQMASRLYGRAKAQAVPLAFLLCQWGGDMRVRGRTWKTITMDIVCSTTGYFI